MHRNATPNISNISLVRVTATWALLTAIGAASNATLAFAPIVGVRSPITDIIGGAPILSATSDKHGYLWLTTDRAAYRVGGERFEKFGRHESGRFSLPAPHIEKIASSGSAQLYLGSRDSGVFEWNDSIATFKKKRLSVPNSDEEQPKLVGVTVEGILIIEQSNSTYLYDDRSEEWHKLKLGVDSNRVVHKHTAYSGGNSGALFISQGSHLHGISVEIEADGIRVDVFAESNQIRDVSAIYYDNISSTLFVGNEWGEIYQLDPNTLQKIANTSINQNSSNQVYSLSRLDNFLVLATRRGLYTIPIDEDVVGTENAASLVLDSIVYDIHRTKQNHWITTYDGLYTLSSRRIENYIAERGAILGDVLCFEVDSSGYRWVGSSKGLYRFDESTQEHTSFDDLGWNISLPNAEVTSLATYGDDLWIGFHDGSLRVLDTFAKTAETIDLHQTRSAGITTIVIGSRGLEAIVGTFGAGLHRVPRVSRIPNEAVEITTKENIHRALKSDDGSYFVLSESGLITFKSNQATGIELSIELPHQFGSTFFNSFALNEDGSVYLGTDAHGIFYLDLGSTTPLQSILRAVQIGIGTRLENAIIYGLEIDENQNLWASSNIGVFRIDTSDNSVWRYTSTDGLQANEFTFGSSYKDSDGRIYFGGAKGYNVFDPKLLERMSIIPPKIAFYGFSPNATNLVQDITFLENPNIVMTHKDGGFTAYFGVVNPTSFRENTYSVSLHGPETNSTKTIDGNSISFSDLPPGNYILSVIAANSHGIWNQDGANLKISILPPPWKTWWAYTLYLAALVSALWTIHRIYYSYIVERRSEELTIEIEETRNRAEDEVQEQLEFHDELAQAAHQHHGSILKLLRHCLSETIPEFENEPWGDSAEDSPSYMKALSLLEDCTVYDEGDVSIDLTVFVEKLFPAIMPYCQVDPDTIITVNEVKGDPITLEVGTTLAVIIYELALNAISHAYTDDSPANYLRVISRTEYSKESGTETYSITVRDSGEGIQKDALDTAPPGSGIALVQSLADNIGAKFSYSYRKGTMAKVTLEITESSPIFA